MSYRMVGPDAGDPRHAARSVNWTTLLGKAVAIDRKRAVNRDAEMDGDHRPFAPAKSLVFGARLTGVHPKTRVVTARPGLDPHG